MADLPKMRTSETFPFENTGLDFIGPLHIDREDGCTKGYMCLFTCMVTRSIHLELLSDLSAERFIQALNRFVARRGYPRIIQSDNFSTFKMADRQLKNLFAKPSLDKIQRTMIRHRIEWKFITKRAPWNGGYWERLVRSVKNTLRKILEKTTLDEEELTTVLCEIEAKINARPLTFVGDDVKDADALTPFHFLIGRSFVDLPMMSTPTVEEDELPLNRKWRKRQQIILHFWKRWRNEYVTTFVSRTKWMTKRQEPKEGDIVLVKEDNTKRENWPIGRITSILPGSDGLSITVEVKTAKGTFTRPVARFAIVTVDTVNVYGNEGTVVRSFEFTVCVRSYTTVYFLIEPRSPRNDGTCLIPVYSVDTVWENRNHKKLIRLIKSVSVEKKRLIFNTDVEVV
ncbi:hypothetical protein T09_9840 [Trichinella sp. T9]|nr:hypothetical protein T09_9840 [Trichinella sp. T9]